MNQNKIYETERLYLKPAATEDAPFIFELLNTPKWIQFIGDRNVTSVEVAKQYIIDRMLPQFERLGYGNYILIRKDDGTKIGSCGLYDREGLEGIDIGFAFLPAYEKKGYAYEAASKMMELASNTFNISEINAITLQENTASQNLLKKIGLKFVKIINIPGDPADLMLFQAAIEGLRK